MTEADAGHEDGKVRDGKVRRAVYSGAERCRAAQSGAELCKAVQSSVHSGKVRCC